jgi:hypothetical protein
MHSLVHTLAAGCFGYSFCCIVGLSADISLNGGLNGRTTWAGLTGRKRVAASCHGVA